MNQFSISSPFQSRMQSRSMGVKLILVCALALLMMIPALFVWALISDRTDRKAAVVREISDHVGGQQTFLGPVLAIPYTIPAKIPSHRDEQGTYLVFPAQASATAKTTTEEHRRSLFKVPVFQVSLDMSASFDLTGILAAAPADAQFDWSHAEMMIGVSDARGAQADALLTANGKTSTLAPASLAVNMQMGNDRGEPLKLTLFGTEVGDLAKPGAQFEATSYLRFSGAQRIAVLAYGKTTHLAMQGDWPNPSFDGGFLPVSHSENSQGFTAEWSVPFMARGVRAEGVSSSITGLDAAALGVSFVEVADPYQSVTRSLKYVPLFVGLLFLSYFVFEVTSGKRVHPAQYLLVGVAQIIFYLLLLALAERIGFDFGFLIAGAATVVLLAANAGWIFASRPQGFRALAVFTFLYVLIYLLLRLEDNALLVGAIASFAAVAAAMYCTRGIDWYSSLPDLASPQPIAGPLAGGGDAK